ncbi:3-keto-disaccharide hydrolase [Maribacter spongiicola]|uniref:3-keto-disaccharide hydrolase n=1 Tax=Maribacter spongiicola TaxID=1206753 RepID=UPI003F955840
MNLNKNVWLSLFSILVLSIIVSCGTKKSDAEKEDKVENTKENTATEWVSIFNGNDLTGWTIKIPGHELGENFGNTLRVEDGILKVRYDEYGPEFGDRFGTVYYDKYLTNYRLKVVYRFVGETAPGAPTWGYRDSGIQFHGQPPATQKLDQAFPVCLEFNFHGGNGTDERPLGAACTNGMFIEHNRVQNKTTCIPADVLKTFHGDQWVTAEIDIKDGLIIHYVNGEEILRYSNPTYNIENATAKLLMTNGDKRVKGGFISLQSNSHPIDFRSIELMEY